MKTSYIYIVLLVLSVIIIGCSSSKEKVSDLENQVMLEKIVASTNFTLEARWAYPLASGTLNQLAANNLLGFGNTGGRINLMGNTNYLTVENDSVNAYLPYYGERQIGGGYNSNNGIEFIGIPDNYLAVFNKEKQRFEISFSITEAAENYDVHIILFLNKKAQISINSTQRSSIRYAADLLPTSK